MLGGASKCWGGAKSDLIKLGGARISWGGGCAPPQ